MWVGGRGWFGCRFDEDGAGGGGGEAVLIGHDVVDGVGNGLGCVEDDVAHERAVEEGLDAEVEVGRGAGDGDDGLSALEEKRSHD